MEVHALKSMWVGKEQEGVEKQDLCVDYCMPYYTHQ